MAESADNITKVCQRIKTGDDTIYALIEFECHNPELPDPPRRFQTWRSFESEAELSDFIRRDTGEPLTLPAYSLTPAQSNTVQLTSKAQVTQITEEFRRFRVKAEIMKKQADAQIRDLHNSHVISATKRIEGEDLVSVTMFICRNIYIYNSFEIVVNGFQPGLTLFSLKAHLCLYY